MDSTTTTKRVDEGATAETYRGELAGKYLSFVLNEEFYGVDILAVREIIGLQDITRVPDADPCILGVINLRGQVIPLIDLRTKFGMVQVVADEETCIIIVDVDNTWVGMVVDKVDEVIALGKSDIEPPPRFAHDGNQDYVMAMGKVSDGRLLILLDVCLALAAKNNKGPSF